MPATTSATLRACCLMLGVALALAGPAHAQTGRGRAPQLPLPRVEPAPSSWNAARESNAEGEPSPSSYCDCPEAPRKSYAPLVGDVDDGKCPVCGKPSKPKTQHVVTHYVGYDKGFFIRPFNAAEYPFDLRLRGRTQFRQVTLSRNRSTWTDSTGTVHPVDPQNYFDIERARLLLGGHFVDPRLSFFLQIDGDTDGGHVLEFLDYWLTWEFTESMRLYAGKRKVPGSRNWMMSAFNTLLIDRSMATDFFRPDRTVGMFLEGSLRENLHYEAMLGNGYHAPDVPPTQLNNRFAYAISNWIDLGSDFGTGLSDHEFHDVPAVQLGHSFTGADQRRGGNNTLSEATFLRLTDGTVLANTGALAPGVTVDAFTVYLYSLDAALKYRGYSVNGECFFRWIQDIHGNGPVPHTSLFQRGFFVQGSAYVVPKTVYLAARFSQIAGLFGTSQEYAAGINWYLNGNQNLKLGFDMTVLDGSPLNNTASDILVGDNGLLFRSQFQAMF